MKTINKALDILEIFLDQEHSIGVLELSRISGLNPSTVNRICLNLVKRGYLNQSSKRGKYTLGLKFFDFTSSYMKRSTLRDLAMPFLLKLKSEVGETVTLTCLKGTNCMQLAIVKSGHLLSINPEEGSLLPLYNTGIGKAILAYFTNEQLDEYAEKVNFEKTGPNTITNLADLKKNLLTIKKQGVAFDNQECILGASNVASAIKGKEGNILGSVGVVGPTARLTPNRMKEIAPLVKKCASDISINLGY
jgi:IclR family transcriptional regulator, KDG regulon repressor